MNPWVFWIAATFIIVGLWLVLAENTKKDGEPFINIGLWIVFISFVLGAV